MWRKQRAEMRKHGTLKQIAIMCPVWFHSFGKRRSAREPFSVGLHKDRLGESEELGGLQSLTDMEDC